MAKGSKKQKKATLKKRRLIVIVTVCIVIVVAAAVYFLVIKNDVLNLKGEPKLTVKEQRANDLRQALVSSDDKKSDKYFDESIAKAGSDEARAAIYSERAAYTFYSDDVTKAQKKRALSDAQQAYKLHNGPSEARLIVDIATSLKQKSVVDTYTPILNEYLNQEVKKPGENE